MWKEHYDQRLQHALSHMNHHIYPLNPATCNHTPLKSCRRKGRPFECKGGFPLESEMLEQTVIVCPCLAEEKGWIQTGPRSVLGGVMPRRNSEWLNPGPSAWSVFTGDNGDMKLPRKIPTLPETLEKMSVFNSRRSCCVSAVAQLQYLYDMTAMQSMMAGYFGGYSSKMQDIGSSELQRLREAVERKVDCLTRLPLPKEFQE